MSNTAELLRLIDVKPGEVDKRIAREATASPDAETGTLSRASAAGPVPGSSWWSACIHYCICCKYFLRSFLLLAIGTCERATLEFRKEFRKGGAMPKSRHTKARMITTGDLELCSSGILGAPVFWRWNPGVSREAATSNAGAVRDG